jgi:hypothetical protein
MERSMLAFAIAAVVVLTTETSYATLNGTGGAKVLRAPQGASTSRSGVTAPASSLARPARAPGTPAAITKIEPASEPSPVQQVLRRDPLMAAMVSGRLPMGTNLMTVSAGFRDVGEFVGAVNASKNLGIPFHQLKRRMVNDGMTLCLAIQDLRPNSNYRSASRQAEYEASIIVGRP